MSMNAADSLGMYAEGWTNGDAELILQSVTDDYVFDDPNVGTITKAGFVEYLENMKTSIKEQCNGNLPTPFMQLSEVVTNEHDGNLTAWCWWEIPGTDVKGAGLIKVEPKGVYSEIITYYAKLDS